MRPVTTLLCTLCAAALVADLSGCGEESLTSLVRKGTISGTVTFAKLFAAPPPPRPAQQAAAAGVTRATRLVAVKTRGAQRALPALVRPFGQPSGPAFTPNELLVRFRPTAVGAPPVGSLALASRAVAATVGAAMRSRLAGYAAQGQVATTGVSPAVLTARLRVADASRIEEVATRLRADPAVASVGRNGIVWASGRSLGPAPAAPTSGNDPLSPVQAWHYGMIDAPRAWDLTTGSASVLVAVVDDGTRFDHPDIAANLTNDGYDFVSTGSPYPVCGSTSTVDNTGDGDGYDPDPTDPISYDYNFTNNCVTGPSALGNHGLHVAGTIGAVGNNGVGGTGVNWTVRIRPVRVLDVIGSGTYYDVAQGILYAAGLPADNGAGGTVQPTTGARVINLSLGGPQPDATLQDAVIAATNAGALVVAAAGNSGTTTLNYPAAYPQAVSVSAVGPDGRLASYSSFGFTVGIAAPGGDFAEGSARGLALPQLASYGVASTVWNFQLGQPAYAFYEGTSMATPHVTGVAALVLALNPALNVAALRARLTSFAVDVGSDGPDILYGAGIVNARNSLTQSLAPPHQLYARLYDAASGAVVATQAAGGDGSYAFAGLSEGSYDVFAGEDENGDHVLGSPGRRWGAFGSVTAPTVITVAKGGAYAAPFTIGLPLEREPNDAIGDADLLFVGGSLYGTLPPGDFDVTRIPIVTAGQYTFETSGWEGACGFALEEDTIIELYDAAANFIDGNDDINPGLDNFCSRITTSLSAGTYYLLVYAFNGGFGGQYRVYARAGP